VRGAARKSSPYRDRAILLQCLDLATDVRKALQESVPSGRVCSEEELAAVRAHAAARFATLRSVIRPLNQDPLKVIVEFPALARMSRLKSKAGVRAYLEENREISVRRPQPGSWCRT
jgi:hypothetical protein